LLKFYIKLHYYHIYHHIFQFTKNTLFIFIFSLNLRLIFTYLNIINIELLQPILIPANNYIIMSTDSLNTAVSNLVGEVPINTLSLHGSPSALEHKIIQVICNSTTKPINRPRGRPKGSKNKHKDTPAEPVSTEKRARGRPKGSKNKPKNTPAEPVSTEKRTRGRPKGSKNKPK
jgi:hypothetical protein